MNLKRVLFSVYRFAAANPRMQWLNKLLLECAHRGMGIHNFESPGLTGEKHLYHRVLPRKLAGNSEAWVVDVGANVGSVSKTLRGRLPENRLLAIEPHPANFRRLEENLAGDAVLLNAAAGACQGTLELYDYDRPGGSSHASIYRDVFTELHKSTPQPTTVPVETLDAICQQHGIERIGFLKIDTEGHELEVLKGCSRLLAEGRIESIQIEFNTMNVVSGVFLRDILKQLTGFTAYRLLPRSMTPLPSDCARREIFGFQNLWLVRDRAAASQAASDRRAA